MTTETIEQADTATPVATYSGRARVLDRNGMLLDVGRAELTAADEWTWTGSLRVFVGSCLQNKSLTVLLEVDDGRRAPAQVGPKIADAGKDLILVRVTGIDRTPF